MNWGLRSKALYTIYKGAILPLIIYGVPVWIKALEKECNRKIYKGVSKSPRTMLITRKSLVVHEFPARVCCGGVL